MDVRICGPNLSDQSKGTFHVHRDGCADLKQYGPGRKFGGELFGDLEVLITDATVKKVVYTVYDNGIIDERAAGTGVSKDEAAQNYVGDFWFAPCCGDLPVGGWDEDAEKKETIFDVFECWIADNKNSFAKLESDDKFGVAEWVMRNLPSLSRGQHMHIVRHSSDEYSEFPGHG